MPQRNRFPARSTYLLYDSGCGPCTVFMKMISQLDVHRQIIPVSFYDANAAKLAGPSMSKRRLFSSFHLVEISKEKREVFSAGEGAIRLTKYLPLGSLTYNLVRHTKFLRSFIRRMYFQATRIRAASRTCSV